jgi:hypothetical protein
MVFFRALRRHHQSLNLDYTQNFVRNPRNTTTLISHESRSISSLFRSYASISAQTECGIDTSLVDSTKLTPNLKKPLHLLFKEAVGLLKTSNDSEADDGNCINELNKNLQKLEIEVRNLKENKRRNANHDSEKPISEEHSAPDDREKPTRLYDLFKAKKDFKKKSEVAVEPIVYKELSSDISEEHSAPDDREKPTRLYDLFEAKKDFKKKSEVAVEPIVYKELSSEMAFLANHLHNQGYFVHATFVTKRFDAICFENYYGRQFLKHAAVKFGKDNQEIVKLLSGDDLKTVAQFGCPSFTKKNVLYAKTMRKFFKIQEDTVCNKCILKPSCKYANQNIWDCDVNTLSLSIVMRIIVVYGLEDGPPELVVADDVKASLGRLIKEIIRLTETVK